MRGATFTPIKTNAAITRVSIPAFIPILLMKTALSKSVATQKSNAPVNPNLAKTQTITSIKGIAINDPIKAVLNKGRSEFLQITYIIPAIRGHTIKKAKAMLVNNNPFSIIKSPVLILAIYFNSQSASLHILNQ